MDSSPELVQLAPRGKRMGSPHLEFFEVDDAVLVPAELVHELLDEIPVRVVRDADDAEFLQEFLDLVLLGGTRAGGR